MLTQHTVLGQLRLLTELDEKQAREALPFCAAAVDQLLPRLKKDEAGGFSATRRDPRLARAAATAALVMLLQRAENTEGDGIESFKAGDITVSKRGQAVRDRLRMAIVERDAAFDAIAELLKDTGFAFEATRVK